MEGSPWGLPGWARKGHTALQFLLRQLISVIVQKVQLPYGCHRKSRHGETREGRRGVVRERDSQSASQWATVVSDSSSSPSPVPPSEGRRSQNGANLNCHLTMITWDPEKELGEPIVPPDSYADKVSYGRGREREEKVMKIHLPSAVQTWKWHSSRLPRADARGLCAQGEERSLACSQCLPYTSTDARAYRKLVCNSSGVVSKFEKKNDVVLVKWIHHIEKKCWILTSHCIKQ